MLWSVPLVPTSPLGANIDDAMRAEVACPAEETLVRFLAGRAGEGERDSIVQHVDGCSACALVLGLPTGATVLGLPRGPTPITPAVRVAPTLLAASLRDGRVLADRYRIVQLLGAGGMGEVYEAFDMSLGEPVALKTVRATISDNPRAVELLKSEVQLARRVTHPNVCRIFDFGVDGGAGTAGEPTSFLTMELLRGTTLAGALLNGEPFARDEALRLAAEIAAGLAAAHRVGVIHKDLKSENVILTRSSDGMRHAFVTDFGLAATRSVVEHGARSGAGFSGTPGYVAPERLAGAPATEASDIFAFGVVLEDLATGTLPLRRPPGGSIPTARDPLTMLASRCKAMPPSGRPHLAAILDTLRRLEQPRRGARAKRAFGWGAVGIVLVAGVALVGNRVAFRRLLPASVPAANVAVSPATPEVVSPARAETAVAPPPPGEARAAPGAPSPVPRRRPRDRRAPAAIVAHAAPEAVPSRTAAHQSAALLEPPARDDEPIRSLGAAPTAVPRDDAPIDPFAHASAR